MLHRYVHSRLEGPLFFVVVVVIVVGSRFFR
jgi:hypothetical protein